jgi:hypothetical protein
MAAIHCPALRTYLATAGPIDRSKFFSQQETESRNYIKALNGQVRLGTQRQSPPL